MPANPQYLIPAVRQINPIIHAAAKGKKFKGGIYPIPELYQVMKKENKIYKKSIPKPWQLYSDLSGIYYLKTRWRKNMIANGIKN
jgi:hypothetical protein